MNIQYTALSESPRGFAVERSLLSVGRRGCYAAVLCVKLPHTNKLERIEVASKRITPSEEEKPWRPNSVSLVERVVCLLVAVVLLARGASGFLYSRLSVSPPRQRLALVLQGGPAWLMAAAMVIGACVLLSVVVDHYDKRKNEGLYRVFRRTSVALGLCLIAASLVSFFINGFSS